MHDLVVRQRRHGVALNNEQDGVGHLRGGAVSRRRHRRDPLSRDAWTPRAAAATASRQRRLRGEAACVRQCVWRLPRAGTRVRRPREAPAAPRTASSGVRPAPPRRRADVTEPAWRATHDAATASGPLGGRLDAARGPAQPFSAPRTAATPATRPTASAAAPRAAALVLRRPARDFIRRPRNRPRFARKQLKISKKTIHRRHSRKRSVSTT